jgi:tyrosyl-tRNA synthetase
MMNVDEQLRIIKKGTVEIISEDELIDKLKLGKPLRIKAGFDPTAPDLHLGHTVLLQKLRDFQRLGHEVFFLIGDFTALIGDPSGRMEARKKMTQEEVLINAKTYERQVFKILDREKTKIVFNSEWLSKLSFQDVLELTSRYTVARMLERDDFEKRYKSGKPISIMEFLYPLIQGYDSVELRADVEIGGTDQKFNLLVGRELQKEYGQKPQVVITMPLLVGLDGKMKMSKSYNNYIALEDEPNEMFGKIMSIPDELMYDYFVLLTDRTNEEVEKMKEEVEKYNRNPRDIKLLLAYEITRRFWGEELAKKAQDEFLRVFSKHEIPEDIEVFRFDLSNVRIIDALVSSKLVSSKKEAKRLIMQNAVSINGKKVNDIDYVISFPGEYIVKVGKKRFMKFI